MSRTEYYTEALASMSYPQQKYRMVNTGAAPMPNYGKVSGLDVLGVGLKGFATVMQVRNAERLGNAQLEMQERLAQRQAITAAAVASKQASLDAQKSKYFPVYIAGGLLFVGIVSVTFKQIFGK